MLPFRSAGGATFFCRTDFRHVPFANISFFDSARARVLFHLSLRRADNLAVVNRRDAAGWRRELAHDVALNPDGVRVEIRFGFWFATVWLDGVRLGRFARFAWFDRQGRWFLRRGFGGLTQIAHVDLQGGVRDDSIALSGRANTAVSVSAPLVLTDRLELEERSRAPGHPRWRALEISGHDDPPPVLERVLPYLRPGGADGPGPFRHEIGRRATLPGRVWQTVGPGEDLVVILHREAAGSGGADSRTPLRIRRDDVLARIEALAAADSLEHDAFAALQMIEHIRFAGLFGRLSPVARQAIGRVAKLYGLTGFLFPPVAPSVTPSVARKGAADSVATDARPQRGSQTGPQTGPEAGAGLLLVPAPPDPPEHVQMVPVRDLFVETMRRAPHTDAIALLRAHPLPPGARRSLFLSLTEFFSARGDFPVLFELAREEGLADFDPNEHVWHNSVIVPFLYMQGRSAEIPELIRSLHTPERHWFVTPALGWVIGDLAAGPARAVGERTRDEVLRAFMELVDAEARDYWGRSACVHLIGATVQALAHPARFAESTQRDIAAFALRCHGLSRVFWRDVDKAASAGQMVLSPQMRLARGAFDTIAARIAAGPDAAAGTGPDTGPDMEALSRALAVFDRLGTPDAARFRRELMGPAGIAQRAGRAHRTAPDPVALTGTLPDPGEAALRYLAFPGVEPGQDAASEMLTDMAVQQIARCYDQVPQAPYYRLQGQVGRRCAALLGRLEGGAAPDGPLVQTGEIDSLADDLATLSGVRSGFVGLRPALALLAVLERRGATASTAALLAHLERIHAGLTPDERAILPRAPAFRGALHSLRIAAPDSPAVARIQALFGGSETDKAPSSVPLPAPCAGAPWPGASPLFDTIVTVFSCRAHLETRIPALQAGWLDRLDRLGVPYVVVVGDGDGRRAGNLVHLDAPDDYEGLPQKSLAAIRWVHEQTTFAHMLKIDDDCFLDADEFFHSLSYAKFDYYGRTLTRVRGQTDRVWHCAKSGSRRGRLELDKSPEPSVYADGGSGYALSRDAMAAVLSAAASPAGQHLRLVSFMEDKLIGDLLTLGGIEVASEDYRCAVLRRARPGGIAVSHWENGFLPFAGSGLKLVHLDDAQAQPVAAAQLRRAGLSPRKIWPGFQPARLGASTNALELVSPADRLEAARESPVAVVACLRNEMSMLPHFLAHYRKLGVTAFLIADNCSDDGTLEYLAQAPDVAVFSVDTDYRRSHYGVAWQQALMANFRVGRWSLMADADELLVWQLPPGGSLPELLAGPEFAAAEAARVFMLDMYPAGPLAEADFTRGDPFEQAGHVDRIPFLLNSGGRGPFSDADTWTSALRHRLIPGSRSELFVAQKIALLKYHPWMRLSAGLHYVADVKLARRALLFAHFKYTADFRAKAVAEVGRGQHFNDAEEYRKYLALLAEGRDVIHDPEVSVPWRESDFVRQICCGG